ncbi:permease, partial [Candidatus Woesebacteria bacterium]|nr:permease [Candidatus Woesebacteria bacterium]
YDTIKIFILLVTINYVMAATRHFLPVQKIRDILTKRKWYGADYLLASLFGVITPFCSCSSIPLFVGFLSAGIPLGVTLAFLITSPLVNEASIAIFIGIFGLQTTLLYVASGVIIGTVGGILLGKMKLENSIDDSLRAIIAKKPVAQNIQQSKVPLSSLLIQFWHEGWEITKSIFLYVVVGVGVGAIIHGYLPVGFFEKYLANGNWWSVPLATILAVPLYSNAVGVIPVMQVLVSKGVPLGTALSFMMATVGLSFPEALILKKAMKPRLLYSFFITVTLGIMLIGTAFNLLSK